MFGKIKVKKLFEDRQGSRWFKTHKLSSDVVATATFTINGGEAGFDVVELSSGRLKIFVPKEYRI